MNEALELNHILRRWLRWYRFQRTITWSVRGVLMGLGFALIMTGILIPQGRLVPEEFWRLVVGGTITGLILASVTATTWPIPRLEAAHFFDRRFGLQERVSTALEFAGEGQGQANNQEIIQKQLADALQTARQVDVYRLLPLRFKGLEICLIAVMLIGTLFLARWAVPYFSAAQNVLAIQQAISEQAAQVEALHKQIEQNESLSPEQRQTLTAPLEEALRKLVEAKTLEQAASAVNDAQQQLSALNPEQSQQQNQALQEVGQQLSSAQDSPLQQFGEKLASGDYQGAAQELKNLDPNTLDPTHRDSLANELSQAASNLRASNPQLAEQLQAAGEALQKSGETAQANQQASRSLQQAAQTLQERRQNLAQAQAAAQVVAQLSQGQQQMVAQAGQSASSASQSGSAQQTGQNSAGGAGRGEQTGESETGSEAGTSPIQQNNAPGDGGESQYDRIYAPQRLGDSQGEDMQLPNSGLPGDQVIGQSAAAPGAPGLSSVPYTEALPTYQDAYRQAIESGQIPLHLRPLIRDYFSSLEP